MQIAELDAAEQVEELMILLNDHPDYGKIIPGGAGLRKIRIGLPGRGKRGGARVIYYDVSDKRTILFLTAYAKNELENLSAQQTRKLIAIRDELVHRIRKARDEKND